MDEKRRKIPKPFVIKEIIKPVKANILLFKGL